MRYKVNQDYHIHSQLSNCSGDPEQTVDRLFQYAEENEFSSICLTDHFWDEKVPGASEWYSNQNFEHICKALPLMQSDKVRFYFGCETELDKNMTLGITAETMDKLDFIIIPTTHLHMTGFTIDESDTALERRVELYVKRFQAVLDMDLPFSKIGIAHLTCDLMAHDNPDDFLVVLGMISDDVFKELFEQAADRGVGIELNFPALSYKEPARLNAVLRPYRIAAECGCKFYFGSDAHHPANLVHSKENFEYITDLLRLTEEQRFTFK